MIWKQPIGCLSPLISEIKRFHAVREQIISAISAHKPVVSSVLALMNSFSHAAQLKPAAIATRWQRRLSGRYFVDLSLLATEVEHHRSSARHVADAIPDSISIGLFELHFVSVKTELMRLHDASAAGILVSLSEWIDNTAEAVMRCAAYINSRVRARCKTVADSLAVEEYSSIVPALLAKLSVVCARIMKASDVLDAFRYDY